MTKVLWAASRQMRPNITDYYDPYPLMTWAAGPKHPPNRRNTSKANSETRGPRRRRAKVRPAGPPPTTRTDSARERLAAAAMKAA
ncbi:hypothetical protein GCM10010326_68990 [Streptomyces xanthochromogenes]|uniref:Uncharacterized protein n=1 Tax=Streptomyces xanthochromogenes TaxID=67384 RepID=A0ABQ3ARG1_9ACTN|nr:hypothetical protein GCM10010326_68990 [Streptomyces xanthochromogenes]